MHEAYYTPVVCALQKKGAGMLRDPATKSCGYNEKREKLENVTISKVWRIEFVSRHF